MTRGTPRSQQTNQQTGSVGTDGGFWTRMKSGFADQKRLKNKKTLCHITLRKYDSILGHTSKNPIKQLDNESKI